MKGKTPFKSWTVTKFFHEKEGRWYVVLTKPGRKQKCTAYARYKMSVKLGRKLKKSEQVDHKDEDKTNDKYRNLQILTCKENINKHFAAAKGKKPCCSRSCSSKSYGANQYAK